MTNEEYPFEMSTEERYLMLLKRERHVRKVALDPKFIRHMRALAHEYAQWSWPLQGDQHDMYRAGAARAAEEFEIEYGTALFALNSYTKVQRELNA